MPGITEGFGEGTGNPPLREGGSGEGVLSGAAFVFPGRRGDYPMPCQAPHDVRAWFLNLATIALAVMETTSSLPPASRRPAAPASLILRMALPFALPFALTLIILATVGEAWPRSIAPGSGLKLAGLIASALAGGAVWRTIVHAHADERVHKFAVIGCSVTALMGWPVWTVGVLPSVNGASLGREEVELMRLGRIDVTRPSKGPGFYYWAWLEPVHPGAGVAGGRYFIPETVYQRWAPHKPATVRVTHARGLLGAEVVTRYR